jgi:hypothetical protein
MLQPHSVLLVHTVMQPLDHFRRAPFLPHFAQTVNNCPYSISTNARACIHIQDVDLPPAFKTIAASLAAGAFRIVLMPVDALKTIMQVCGGVCVCACACACVCKVSVVCQSF